MEESEFCFCWHKPYIIDSCMHTSCWITFYSATNPNPTPWPFQLNHELCISIFCQRSIPDRVTQHLQNVLFNPNFSFCSPIVSLWPSSSELLMIQVMTCYLMTPSHYLNQSWLIIKGVCSSAFTWEPFPKKCLLHKCQLWLLYAYSATRCWKCGVTMRSFCTRVTILFITFLDLLGLGDTFMSVSMIWIVISYIC